MPRWLCSPQSCWPQRRFERSLSCTGRRTWAVPGSPTRACCSSTSCTASYVADAAGAPQGHELSHLHVRSRAGSRSRDRTHYGTNSLVVQNPYRPNETEVYARWRVIGAEAGRGFAVSVNPAYNFAAHSADGELSVDYNIGGLTLSGAARGMTKAFGSIRPARRSREAPRRGSRLYRGERRRRLVREPDGARGVGVALNVLIPGSPHTFSFQASNATTSTLEGNSIGFSKMLYGFEFTIPLHLKRFSPWFHRAPKHVASDRRAEPRSRRRSRWRR